MLPQFSQYSPLGLLPPFPAPQGIGAMPGAGQSPGFGGAGTYGQGFYGQGEYGPFLGSSPFMSPYAHHQAIHSLYTQPGGFHTQPGAQPGGTFSTALQVIPLIGHLAQQIHLQSGVTQQIGVALNHLAQQLAVLVQQAMLSQQVQGGAGLGFSAGQGLGLGGQPFGFTPFGGATGLGGQSPPWAAQRSQTIQ